MDAETPVADDELAGWLQDVLAAEHFVRASTEQLLESDDVAGDAGARRLLGIVADRAARHVCALETQLEAGHRQSPSELRRAVGAGLGVTLGWAERLPSRDLVHVVRDVYVALNFIAGGYHVLFTRAVLLERAATSTLALRHLRDYTPAIRELSHLLAWASAVTPSSGTGRASDEQMADIVSELFASWSSDIELLPTGSPATNEGA